MRIARPPTPELAPWVSELFVRASDGGAGDVDPLQERTLPTGAMHCVFRLVPPAIHIRDADAAGATPVGHAAVSGARSRFYLRDLQPRFVTVGAMLRPGASQALFGAPADVLAGRHTRLEDVWGALASSTRDRLGGLAAGEAQLRTLEEVLLERVRRQGTPLLSALTRFALRRFETTDDVGAVVRESGYSHRVFAERFKAEVGLTPKRYCRVQRFQRAVAALEQAPPGGIAEVAARLGYADQAHLDREFREMAGLSPTAHRAGGGSNSSKPQRRRR